MEFNLLFTKNLQQGIIRSFKLNELPSTKIIDIDTAKSLPLQGFILSENIGDDNLLAGLENELKFYPIHSNSEFGLNADQFERLNYNEAKIIFDKMREHWILQNNISLIGEIFKVRGHLVNLWPNDRSGFFEELWFILKSNLGATNLRLVYNDILKGKGEHEKNKLIRVKVTGERFPETTSITEMDEAILKSYEKEFGNIFEITDYNKEKGQLVICATIKKSPILIMANIYQLTRLQKAILTSLFEGLQ